MKRSAIASIALAILTIPITLIGLHVWEDREPPLQPIEFVGLNLKDLFE